MRAHKPVTIVFDDRLLLHLTPTAGHDEQHNRILAIFHRLRLHGLLTPDLVRIIGCRYASDEDILAVHTQSHIDLIDSYDGRTQAIADRDGGRKYLDAAKARAFHLEPAPTGHPFIRYYDDELDIWRWNVTASEDTYAGPFTPMAAKLSAGGCLQAVDALVKGESSHAFAIVRPPGHHCHACEPGGFCFYNNVGIAARYAQRKYGLKKIAIVDFDCHHGDGGQTLFYDDDSVLFLSVHRGDGVFYPKTGKYTEVGSGKGLGFNVNIPFAEVRMGEAEYAACFENLVIPIVSEFDPDMVIVSGGFDAAEGDNLGGMKLNPGAYRSMVASLATLVRPKHGVLVALEGGYNLASISACGEGVVRGLLEAAETNATSPAPPKPVMPPSQPPSRLVHSCAYHIIKAVAATHAPYWRSMAQLHETLSPPQAPPSPASAAAISTTSTTTSVEVIFKAPLKALQGCFAYQKETVERAKAFTAEAKSGVDNGPPKAGPGGVAVKIPLWGAKFTEFDIAKVVITPSPEGYPPLQALLRPVIPSSSSSAGASPCWGTTADVERKLAALRGEAPLPSVATAVAVAVASGAAAAPDADVDGLSAMLGGLDIAAGSASSSSAPVSAASPATAAVAAPSPAAAALASPAAAASSAIGLATPASKVKAAIAGGNDGPVASRTRGSTAKKAVKSTPGAAATGASVAANESTGASAVAAAIESAASAAPAVPSPAPSPAVVAAASAAPISIAVSSDVTSVDYPYHPEHDEASAASWCADEAMAPFSGRSAASGGHGSLAAAAKACITGPLCTACDNASTPASSSSSATDGLSSGSSSAASLLPPLASVFEEVEARDSEASGAAKKRVTRTTAAAAAGGADKDNGASGGTPATAAAPSALVAVWRDLASRDKEAFVFIECHTTTTTTTITPTSTSASSSASAATVAYYLVVRDYGTADAPTNVGWYGGSSGGSGEGRVVFKREIVPETVAAAAASSSVAALNAPLTALAASVAPGADASSKQPIAKLGYRDSDSSSGVLATFLRPTMLSSLGRLLIDAGAYSSIASNGHGSSRRFGSLDDATYCQPAISPSTGAAEARQRFEDAAFPLLGFGLVFENPTGATNFDKQIKLLAQKVNRKDTPAAAAAPQAAAPPATAPVAPVPAVTAPAPTPAAVAPVVAATPAAATSAPPAAPTPAAAAASSLATSEVLVSSSPALAADDASAAAPALPKIALTTSTTSSSSAAAKPWKASGAAAKSPAAINEGSELSPSSIVVDDSEHFTPMPLSSAGAASAEEATTAILGDDIHPIPQGLSCIAHLAVMGFTALKAPSSSTPSSALSVLSSAPASIQRLHASQWQPITSPSCASVEGMAPQRLTIPCSTPRWAAVAASESTSEPACCALLTTHPAQLASSRDVFVMASKAPASYRQIASITKCMTMLVVLGVQDALDAASQQKASAAGSTSDADGDVIAATLSSAKGLMATKIAVSKAAAGVNTGTMAGVKEGEVFTAWDLLHGMMLPSGNDAATALAEHYGQFCEPPPEDGWKPLEKAQHFDVSAWHRLHPVTRFVWAMNRTSKALGMDHTNFTNPHGMVHKRDHSTAYDVLRMISAAMSDPRFRMVVSCSKYACEAIVPAAAKPQAPTPSLAAVSASVDTPPAATLVEASSDSAAVPISRSMCSSLGGDETDGDGGSHDNDIDKMLANVTNPFGSRAGAPVVAPTLPPAVPDSSSGTSAAEGATPTVATKPRPPRLISARLRPSVSAASVASSADGGVPTRKIIWKNTNDLLPTSAACSTAVKGLVTDGIKTGITPSALACLTTHGVSADPTTCCTSDIANGSVHTEFFCITLGSRNKTLRFVDNKKLLQWAVEALETIAPGHLAPASPVSGATPSLPTTAPAIASATATTTVAVTSAPAATSPSAATGLAVETTLAAQGSARVGQGSPAGADGGNSQRSDSEGLVIVEATAAGSTATNTPTKASAQGEGSSAAADFVVVPRPVNLSVPEAVSASGASPSTGAAVSQPQAESLLSPPSAASVQYAAAAAPPPPPPPTPQQGQGGDGAPLPSPSKRDGCTLQ